MLRVGYPCLNLTLDAGTSGTLRLANVPDADKVRAVVARNTAALERILPFNAEHGVRLFRLGSGFIPFASHERFPYDWKTEHAAALARLGRLAKKHDQRLSIHPGQYTCPGAHDPGIVARSLAELRYAADLLRLLGAKDGVMVLHIGGAYGDKPAAAERFIRTLEPETNILDHLALENDERLWSPDEVIPIAETLGVGAIVDTLHHRLNPGTLSIEEAVERAAATWPRIPGRPRRPKLHISSQDPTKQPGAHDYHILPDDWESLLRLTQGVEADVMVEAKGKEQALRPLGFGTIPVLEPDGQGPRRGGARCEAGSEA